MFARRQAVLNEAKDEIVPFKLTESQRVHTVAADMSQAAMVRDSFSLANVH